MADINKELRNELDTDYGNILGMLNFEKPKVEQKSQLAKEYNLLTESLLSSMNKRAAPVKEVLTE
jgi:hypothetical protein